MFPRVCGQRLIIEAGGNYIYYWTGAWSGNGWSWDNKTRKQKPPHPEELSKPLDTASSTKTLLQTNSERRRGHQITFQAAEANIAKLIWVERGQNSNFPHKRLCVANQKGKLGKFYSDIINCLTQVIHKSWMRAKIINQRNTKRGSTFYTTWIQSWTFSLFSISATHLLTVVQSAAWNCRTIVSRAGSIYLGQNRLCCVHMYRVSVLPDAGEDEGDDGEAGHAPHHAHLHVQEPGREVSPLCRPELQAAIPLKFRCRGQI